MSRVFTGLQLDTESSPTKFAVQNELTFKWLPRFRLFPLVRFIRYACPIFLKFEKMGHAYRMNIGSIWTQVVYGEKFGVLNEPNEWPGRILAFYPV